MTGYETPRKMIGASARHGAKTWKAERITSVLLVPLTLWAVWAAWTLAGTGMDGAAAFVRQPLNAGLLLLTIAITLWHMVLGMQVVIEDYLHGAMGTLALRLNTLIGWLLFFVSAACLVAAVAGIELGA